MRGGPGGVRLDDILGGTLNFGTVPLARMRAEEISAENAGAVTILVGLTNIVSLASMSVVAGDRILAAGFLICTKGATGGTNVYEIAQTAGTATIQVVNSRGTVQWRNNVLAAEVDGFSTVQVVKVTVGGTLTLTLRAQSAGSNSSVVAADGQIYALRLVGG